MQCVWKEGGCELNPLRNMWLLDTWVMFRIARKFDESGRVLCAKCVELEEERQLMSSLQRCQVRMCLRVYLFRRYVE